MTHKIIQKYWYLFLILIIILTFIIPKSDSIPTSAVVLNLHQKQDLYTLGNPSFQDINITVISNKITASAILHPNQNYSISQKNFTVLGEQHE